MARYDLWTGIALVALGAWVFHLTASLPKVTQGIGPGDYPRVAASGLIVLGGLLAVEALRKLGAARRDLFNKPGLTRILILALLTYGYLQALPHLGFILASPPFLFLAMLLFRAERKWVAAATSLVLPIVVYYVFYHFFQVLLPRFSLW